MVTTITPKSGGNPFHKREFVLDCTRYSPETGEPWENHPRFELSSNNVGLLDNLQVGQKVTVDFTLKGMKYDQNGETKYFTSINAFKVVPVEQQYQPPTAPTYQNPSAQQEQVRPASQVIYSNEVDEVKKDDLPF